VEIDVNPFRLRGYEKSTVFGARENKANFGAARGIRSLRG
jgi:hypothetical protein